MIVFRKKSFSYHIDCIDSDGKRYILPVEKDPKTGKEITSPHRIYYNPDGSVTVKDDKSGKVIKELPPKKKIQNSMILKRKTYSKKDNNSASTGPEEAGKIVGSLGIGAIGGLGLSKTLEKTDKFTGKLADRVEWKTVTPKNKPGSIVPTDAYKLQRGESAQRVAKVIKKGGNKIAKLAKSTKGKAGIATIGALGTLGAISMKKKEG